MLHNQDCHEFRFSIVRIVISSVSNVTVIGKLSLSADIFLLFISLQSQNFSQDGNSSLSPPSPQGNLTGASLLHPAHQRGQQAGGAADVLFYPSQSLQLNITNWQFAPNPLLPQLSGAGTPALPSQPLPCHTSCTSWTQHNNLNSMLSHRFEV